MKITAFIKEYWQYLLLTFFGLTCYFGGVRSGAIVIVGTFLIIGGSFGLSYTYGKRHSFWENVLALLITIGSIIILVGIGVGINNMIPLHE